MLAAYYGKEDSRHMFADRKIAECENWDQYINQFDVVRVVPMLCRWHIAYKHHSCSIERA